MDVANEEREWLSMSEPAWSRETEGGTSASMGSKVRTERAVQVLKAWGEIYGGLQVTMCQSFERYSSPSPCTSPSPSPSPSPNFLRLRLRPSWCAFFPRSRPVSSTLTLLARPACKTSPRRNRICVLATGARVFFAMLCARFLRARAMARGEMSTPRICRLGKCGDRSECRRIGMQPVPVQRSRMRRGGGASAGVEEGLSLCGDCSGGSGHVDCCCCCWCRWRDRIRWARCVV